MTFHTPSASIVPAPNMGPVMLNNAPVLDYDKLLALVDAEDQNRFTGQRLAFAKQWVWGKDKTPVDTSPIRVVVNIPHTIIGWRHFRDEQMTYGPVAYPCAGQQLAPRNVLGDDDQSTWPLYQDKPSDPWKRYLVVPFRVDGESDVNHIMLNSYTGIKEYRGLLRRFATEGRTRMGQLPVVKLGFRLDKHWEDDSITYFVPTFEIIDWVSAQECDIPATPAGSISHEQPPVQAIDNSAPVNTIARTAEKTSEAKTQDEKVLQEAQVDLEDLLKAPAPAQPTAPSKPTSSFPSVAPAASTNKSQPPSLFGTGKRAAAASGKLK